ncbi:cytochrome c biogenesis heme-transporting ATPase CcmA [Microbulbifer sp. OS29]|uniref:Cytochrome c biogenesis heme-transporting ATPase CcmA n=1 Tax=Microbulbifer okhotskensis TaxID=2926617 RepID=A0A9X2J4V3_9GAMM|nr:cytochrome c biogenesis heme-transporting ATPase CcmA [Microbulbifer okhotskensis]MCO1334513.1 cytochrome c biogenesis heme-transporting ATPase CcmA [Microbulbifer okhotskensis]
MSVTPKSQVVLQVTDLTCIRDGRRLFEGLRFSLHAGAAIQVKGSNGAGKTTLLRTLIGSSSEFSGDILWCGDPYPKGLPAMRDSLLYIGHRGGVRSGLTPLENLTWYGANQEAALSALESVDLTGFEDSLCHSLSAGQNRRVALARLFLPNSPRFWILDEPLTALDVAGVAALEEQMAAHLRNGGSILLTSHQPLSLPGLDALNLSDYTVFESFSDFGGEHVLS